MPTAKEQLIYEGGADSMEQECVCAEEGLRGERADQRRRSGWQWRTAPLLLLLLLLLSAALLLLLIAGLQRDKCAPHDEQAGPLQVIPSPDKLQSQDKSKFPRAMLTAPVNPTIGEHLQWETKLGNAFHNGGFDYIDGNLVVPRDGFYRVFLQVAFRLSDKSENQLLHCSVIKLSKEYSLPDDILQTKDFAKCGKETGECIKTLYTSALFYLSENTKLKVKTNRPDLVIENEKLMFFGAEFLSD